VIKKFVVLVFLSFSIFGLFAQANTASLSRITLLIDDGLKKNLPIIQEEAQFLTEEQKFNLYIVNKKSPGIAFVCNFFLGAGIGSFIQGDTAGGLTALMGDVSGLTFILLANIFEVEREYYLNVPNPYMLIGGLSLLLGTRVFELIRPWVFTNSYNANLKKALAFDRVSFALMPVFELNGKTGLTSSIKFNF
jgi:hypothetical protein